MPMTRQGWRHVRDISLYGGMAVWTGTEFFIHGLFVLNMCFVYFSVMLFRLAMPQLRRLRYRHARYKRQPWTSNS